MAATKYTYSIATDFPNEAAATAKLSNDIRKSDIATDLSHINTAGDVCDIWFDDALSAGDETILDGIVDAHGGYEEREPFRVVEDPTVEPVTTGTSKVLANDRPAIEFQNGRTGFVALQGVWPYEQYTAAKMRITAKLILKRSGTGSNVRIGVKYKAETVGDDTSAAFAESEFVVVAVTHTTIGEVFSGVVLLDADTCELDDDIVLHVGRDGNNEMGTATNDDISVPIQIIAIKVEAI